MKIVETYNAISIKCDSPEEMESILKGFAVDWGDMPAWDIVTRKPVNTLLLYIRLRELYGQRYQAYSYVPNPVKKRFCPCCGVNRPKPYYRGHVGHGVGCIELY